MHHPYRVVRYRTCRCVGLLLTVIGLFIYHSGLRITAIFPGGPRRCNIGTTDSTLYDSISHANPTTSSMTQLYESEMLMRHISK